MLPEQELIENIIRNALYEDVGRGDITSNLIVPEDKTTSFVIKARQDVVVCGTSVVARVFRIVDSGVNLKVCIQDGSLAKKDDVIISGKGNARSVMAAERTALNFLRQMCGVATMTAEFVKQTNGTKAKILDTRKTIPGLRILQKYAVRAGGGYNHRYCLDDGILIKDNHISICGSIKKAIEKARLGAPSLTRVEIECDNLDQVREAIESKADVILLDNMNNEQIAEAVKISDGKIPLEASGNVTLERVREIAETGVDFISAGVLTHAPYSVDIGLDIE